MRTSMWNPREHPLVICGLISLPLLVMGCNDGAARPKNKDLPCHYHLKCALDALAEELDARRPNKVRIATIVNELKQRKGVDLFRCPNTGADYCVNPNDQVWNEAHLDRNAEKIAIYCPNPHHRDVLAVSFRGVLLRLEQPPAWATEKP